MKFDELNNAIPYAKGGKEKVLTWSPYANVVLAMPGRHWKDTVPVGGDFCVMVTDPAFGYEDHQFKHSDIFQDVAVKRNHQDIDFFMRAYLSVVTADNPLDYPPGNGVLMPGIQFTTFLCAAQCLAVAEHRRYAKHENKFGGRYLPFRFAAGIAEGLWAAADASNLQRKGRPGVEILERTHGTPILTKELINA